MNSRTISLYLSILLPFFEIVITEMHFELDNPILNKDERKVKQLIEKFFPFESNLRVIKLELCEEEYFPNFHLPVVLYTENQMLEECHGNLEDQDGYVFMTSNTTKIEVQIVPFLKCLNKTTLKIKTKYILVLDSSKGRISFETYSVLFNNLWETFGIINMAILPIQDQSLNAELPFIITYNPFLAHRYSSNASALTRSTLNQNLRRMMTDRFRNIHGYPLRAVFTKSPHLGITMENVREVKKLGANPAVLFKQTFEDHFNTIFDVHENVNSGFEPDSIDNELGVPLGEIANGKADHLILNLISNINWPSTIQIIQIGYSFKFIIVVPKPRQVESWRLFLYIFQWEVSVGLGLTLIALSSTAVLFVVVLSNKFRESLNVTSEILTVWKAFISVSINKLPTRHSQRLLVAVSLLLGLIFITLFSAILFNLMKSRPTEGCIRSLLELQDSNLPIYLSHSAFKLIMDTFENTSLSRLQQNVKRDEEFEHVKNMYDPQHLNITDRAVVYPDDVLYAIVDQPQNRKISNYFEIINEPIFETSMVMTFQKGSVYFDNFKELNLKLVAGGFYRKWSKAFNQVFVEHLSSVSTTVFRPENDYLLDDNQVPLKYDDLKLAFYVLYIGLTISALCFITEIYSCKKYDN